MTKNMQEQIFTTPFGRRRGTLGHLATQVSTRAASSETTAHKWQVFRDVTEIKDALGVADRAVAVLYALLSFHQETALTAGTDLIVFPSNKELAFRAHGIAPATLRRHLAALVEAGLIIRRDSPNGKRYARRGQGGGIEKSFGFDVSPLVARAAEFATLADEARAEKRTVALLRERVTLSRRDIAKLIDIGVEDGVPGDWAAFDAQWRRLSAPMPRNAPRAELEDRAASLGFLRGEIEMLLETHINSQNKSANESHFERHIQNSKTDSSDFEPAVQNVRAESPGLDDPPSRPAQKTEPGKPEPGRTYPLGMVLEACPEIAAYCAGGINSWRDLTATAGRVRSALGISPDAWHQAIEAMGEAQASVVIAAILQKGDAVKSPGGYLRALSDKARAGEFSLGPVLMALMGQRVKGKRRVA